MSSPEQPQIHDDDALLHQVETALRGTSTENPVIDLLARNRPAARPAFQRGLEDMLMARLDEKRTTEGTTPMKLPYLPKRKRNPGRYPLALIAAVLGFVIGGALLLLLGPRISGNEIQSASYYPCKVQITNWNDMYLVQSGDTLSAIAARYNVTVNDMLTVNCLRDANFIPVGTVLRVPSGSADVVPGIPTPDFSTPPTLPSVGESVPIPLSADMLGQWQPVVIAVRDIPANMAITSDMVAVVNWSPEAAAAFKSNQPANSDAQILSGVEQVVGLYAINAIPAWQPVTKNVVRSQLASEVSIIVGSHGTPDYECSGGMSEESIGKSVAENAAQLLMARGYTVNVLAEGTVAHYPGDAVVALYTDACQETWDDLSGYLVTTSVNMVPGNNLLPMCLADEYGKFSGIPRRDYHTADNEQYTLNSRMRHDAVQAVIKLGSLKNDAAALQDTAKLGRGIAEGIACYFGEQSMSSKLADGQVAVAIDFSKFVGGSRDLQAGDKVSITASLVVIDPNQQLGTLPGIAIVPPSQPELAAQQALEAQVAAQQAQQQALAAQATAQAFTNTDPFVLTATSFVAEITQTAQAAMASTAISNGSLDPYMATATAIIVEVTQTAQSMQPSDADVVNEEDEFRLTATAYVAEVTQTAQAMNPVAGMGTIPTPVPPSAVIAASSGVQTAQVEVTAQIMSIAEENGKVMTVALSPTDAVTLTWLLNAEIPLTISLQR